MGIKLMVEVMDHWQDAGLTAGERSDLLVIAENANDGDRQTYHKGGIHQDYILKRVGKTGPAWRNAIGKLMKKGVLTYAVCNGRELSGFPGQVAVYELATLCPEAPHDGLLGQCSRAERVTSQVTQSTEMESEESETGHPTGDSLHGMGHLTESNGSPHRWERVTSQVTPTPLTPLTPLSPPSQPTVTPEPPAAPNDERETTATPANNQTTAAQRAIRATGAVTRDQEQAFIAWIVAKHAPRGPGWWRAATNDLPELAEMWLAEQASNPRSSTSALPAACNTCLDADPAAEFNSKFRTHHGKPCPTCHPNAVPVAA